MNVRPKSYPTLRRLSPPRSEELQDRIPGFITQLPDFAIRGFRSRGFVQLSKLIDNPLLGPICHYLVPQGGVPAGNG